MSAKPLILAAAIGLAGLGLTGCVEYGPYDGGYSYSGYSYGYGYGPYYDDYGYIGPSTVIYDYGYHRRYDNRRWDHHRYRSSHDWHNHRGADHYRGPSRFSGNAEHFQHRSAVVARHRLYRQGYQGGR